MNFRPFPPIGITAVFEASQPVDVAGNAHAYERKGYERIGQTFQDTSNIFRNLWEEMVNSIDGQ